MSDKHSKKRYKDGLDKETGERYSEKLLLIGGSDPYELAKHQLTSDPKAFPAVHYIDVVNYLINSKSAYTMEQLKAYKSLEAFSQAYSGWVKDVQSMTVGENVLVIAKVKHSQRMNETPLKPWVIANKNGVVEAAHCDCMAGLGESCTHVGAVLFYLEAHWRYMSSKTVTQEKAYWPLPAGIDKVPYAEIRDIDFTSAAAKARRIDCAINGEVPEVKSAPKFPNVPEPSATEKEDLLGRLCQAGSNASVLTVSAKYQQNYLPKVLQDGQLPEPLVNLKDEMFVNMEGEELRETCESLFEKLKVTPEQAKNVEAITRRQVKSKEWYRLRMGRITASNMKAVCVANTQKPAISTVKSICGQSAFKSQATEYGCKHEKVALQEYEHLMKGDHVNFKVTESGLWIDPQHPYIGATPDALVSCDCCGEGVVEIKCPYCAKDRRLGETHIGCLKENKLKSGHRYYYQVQTQMLVTRRDYCDFVLWSEKEMKLERIEPNEDTVMEILTKSEKFFKLVLLPELTGSLISREDAAQKCAKGLENLTKSCDMNHQESAAEAQTAESGRKYKRQKLTPVQKLEILQSKENSESAPRANPAAAYKTCTCICETTCDVESKQVVKCDSENCKYGYLHFKCANLKRKPKSPYYCPDCRKSIWK